ncbi:MAG: sulfonate ABC transporter permease, partial [Nostoc sp.]
LSLLTPPRPPRGVETGGQEVGDRLYNLMLLVIIGGLLVVGLHFIVTTVGLGEVLKTFGLALLTLLRVLVLLVFSTLVWTPVGVAIGFNPRLATLLQP